nr:nitric-oxide reductase large subunit [Bacteroides sp.]
MKSSFDMLTDRRTVISRWWIIVLTCVLIYGFATLITVTCKAFRDKPPMPEQVIGQDGNVLFTKADIEKGQQLFLRYGLMDNGSIWGHGAYLGPDFSALYLHDLALNYADSIPDASHRIELAKHNRYDLATGTLVYNDIEARTLAESPARWKDYFSDPAKNGGLKRNLITDPEELRQLSAYFSWAAWATVANRPGADYSYTNNFPAEELVGNAPTTSTAVWSAASLLFLLFGVGGCLFFIGRHSEDDWNPAKNPVAPAMEDGHTPSSIRALLKFSAVVALLFLAQTLVGGAVAHYRAEPGNFYGWDMSSLWPSQLMRSWHLQLAIFWIATGFVIGGLLLSRILGGKEWKGLTAFTNVIFAAFAVVIFGSLLSQWAGTAGWWDNLTFWLGPQGWEYIELGRAWQYALIAGFLLWAFVLLRNTIPAVKRLSTKPLGIVFLIAAFAIPVFYLPAIFFDSNTNFTVVDTWRFWVIHLWVEGFFELFATVMVALVFIEMGLVGRSQGLRIMFLDAILTLMGGIIGTGHHWYFEGQTEFNMAVSSCFSALEVVPLVLLTIEAAGFMRTSRTGGLPGVAHQHRWTLNFFMAVGVWNFVGAGVFGFLINTPIVSYFEIGTQLTPNHGHTAMFGVFGFLALGLSLFAMRKNLTDEQWARITPWIKCSFWGLNIGLALMVILSMLPAGFYQMFDSLKNGYWHARSIEFTNNHTMATLGWLRIIGDVIFIVFGAFPFFVAAAKSYLIGRKPSPAQIQEAES